MRFAVILMLVFFMIPLAVSAQQPPPPPAPPQIAPPPPPPPPPPPGSGKWWKNSTTVSALMLSEAQVSQIEAVFLQHQERLAELRAEVQRNEERLKTLLGSDVLDEKAMAAQRVGLTAARAALEAENSEMSLGIRRVMTAEQWRKLDKIKQDSSVPPLPLPPTAPLPPVKSLPPLSSEEIFNAITHDAKTQGVQEPELLKSPLPPYTAEARAAKIEGIVVLQVVVRKDGSIADAKVIRGLGYGLDESALNTLKTQWRFKPGMLNGQPINVRCVVEISFRLN
jgi:TonB family protein